MIAYKFLADGQIGPFSGARWPAAGEWLQATGGGRACEPRLHACRVEDLPEWMDSELWRVELDGDVRIDCGKLVADRGRLVERVATWDAELMARFAEECALRARDAALAVLGAGPAHDALAGCGSAEELAAAAAALEGLDDDAAAPPGTRATRRATCSGRAPSPRRRRPTPPSTVSSPPMPPPSPRTTSARSSVSARGRRRGSRATPGCSSGTLDIVAQATAEECPCTSRSGPISPVPGATSGSAASSLPWPHYEHADEVTVTWRSFELDPQAPREREHDATTHLSQKYGTTREEALAMHARMTETAAQEGLEFRFDITRGGNTFDAHRLLHLAAAHGAQDAMKERLMRGYLSEGEPIGDPAALERLALEVGLPPDAVRDLLDGDRFAAEVRDEERTAAQLGIRAVPFFVVDRAIGASGAHPPAQLVELLRQARAANPPLPVASSADTCAVDGSGC